MSKILSPKLLIPLLVITALMGLVLYILFAPATWWKPVYVRVETEETPTPESSAQAAPVPTLAHEPQSPSFVAHWQSTGGIMYALDTKVVNLAEPGGFRYLQAAIVLEFYPNQDDYYQLSEEERTVAEEQFQVAMDAHRPVLDDIVMTTLSSKTFSDIATIAGKDTLKQELTAAINEALGYPAVAHVYFTEFVVQ